MGEIIGVFVSLLVLRRARCRAEAVRVAMRGGDVGQAMQVQMQVQVQMRCRLRCRAVFVWRSGARWRAVISSSGYSLLACGGSGIFDLKKKKKIWQFSGAVDVFTELC